MVVLSAGTRPKSHSSEDDVSAGLSSYSTQCKFIEGLSNDLTLHAVVEFNCSRLKSTLMTFLKKQLEAFIAEHLQILCIATSRVLFLDKNSKAQVHPRIGFAAACIYYACMMND